MLNKLLLFLLSFLSLYVYTQNTIPVLTIQNVSIDQVLKTITISYDLADAQNQPCEIWLKMSEDGGEFYSQVPNLNITGDIGLTIPTGTGKNLVWDYSTLTGSISAIKIKLYASDGQPVNIADMVSQIDSNRVKANLTYIEGIRNVTTGLVHLNEVRDSIKTNFLRYELDTETDSFPFISYTGQNFLGRKAGAKDEAITYIMDAHYDGVSNSPAADDNGSGIAGMLEAIRVLSQYEFEHSLRFIAFDFEEPGLIGSAEYVQSAIKPYENIDGVLNYEMIGYYSNKANSQTIPAGFSTLFPQATQAMLADSSRGNFLFVCGNTNSAAHSTLFVNTSAQYVPALKVIKADVPGTGTIAPDLRRSDHAPFWDASKKALMLTDGADFRNHNYHSPNDTLGALNFTFMSNITKATLATMATLAVPISAGSDSYDLSVVSVADPYHFPAIVKLYPNPTQGKLNVSLKTENNLPVQIEIYDMAGKKLWSTTTTFGQGESTQSYSIQHLPQGCYQLIITSEHHIFSQEFMVGK